MSKHRRPAHGSRRTGLAAAALGVAVLTTLGASAPAMAAKGGGSKPPAGGSSTGASCSVDPGTVAVGADWTVTGRDLGAGTFVNVLISDSGGTTAFNLAADGAGVSTLTWHSYWVGTSKVTYQVKQHHGWSTLTTCTFQVS